jgi:hypothetical protein
MAEDKSSGSFDFAPVIIERMRSTWRFAQDDRVRERGTTDISTQ